MYLSVSVIFWKEEKRRERIRGEREDKRKLEEGSADT